MKFHVSHKDGVKEQLFALEALAKKTGAEQAYHNALKQVVWHLQTDPLEWGDPSYNLIHEGGVICHRIVDPLVVRFAVYANEALVHLLEVKALATSPLGGN